MFQNNRTLFSVFATSFIFIAGCGLGDMHDKTLEMADTTKDMAQTTKGMSKTTEKMAAGMDKTIELTTGMSEKLTTTNKMTEKLLTPTLHMDTQMGVLGSKTNFLYNDNRQAMTVTTRAQRLDSLRAASNMGNKLSEASKYFGSFEFQVWKGYDNDTAASRLELMHQATDEFFQEVQQFFKFEKVPMSNDKKNIYALATMLHYKNPSQVETGRERNFKAISMLDMIEAALKYKNDINAGRISADKMLPYMDGILLHEEYALKLLRARQSFLLLMTYGKIVNTDENTFNGLFGEVAAKMRTLPFVTWKAKLYKKNVVQILNYNKYIRASLRMRKLLLDIGANANLENGFLSVNLYKIFLKMNVLAVDPKGPKPEEAVARAISEFVALRDLVIKADADFLKVDEASYACTELVCGDGYGVITSSAGADTIP